MTDQNALIKEFNDAKVAYTKLVSEKGKALLAAVFGQMFAVEPRIRRIQWRQYTPYFNDGEACEFSVHDRSFDLAPLPTDDGPTGNPIALPVGDDEDDYEDEDDDQEWAELPYSFDRTRYGGEEPYWVKYWPGVSESTLRQLKQLNDTLESFEDVLKITFDDHVKVTATKNADGTVTFVAESYDHE